MTKKLIVSFCICSSIIFSAFSQSEKVTGYWLTEKGDSQIQIFQQTDGRFYGKIVWLKNDQNAVDDKNPSPKLQNRKILGLQLLNSFQFNKRDNEWINGSIYDPESGKTYDCYMWFENDKNILKIKGFVMGMRFLGRETSWKRENALRNQTVSASK